MANERTTKPTSVAAHARLDALSFQVEMYELFQRSAGGRLGHVIGTPTVALGVAWRLFP